MILSLTALLLSAAPPPTSSAPPGGGFCPSREPRYAQGDPAQAQRLDQLPPGDLYLTVMREVNGCMEAVVVREDYGLTTPRRAARDPHRPLVPQVRQLPPGRR